MVHSSVHLTYRVLDGTFDPAPLRILAHESTTWNNWRISFCVLGASHAVCFENEGQRIWEALTCAPGVGTPPLFQTTVQAPVCRDIPVGGGVLTVRLWRESLTASSLCLPAGDGGLRREFPAAPDTASPVTALSWELAPGYLRLHTVHSYPAEGVAVRSTTEFRPKEEVV